VESMHTRKRNIAVALAQDPKRVYNYFSEVRDKKTLRFSLSGSPLRGCQL